MIMMMIIIIIIIIIITNKSYSKFIWFDRVQLEEHLGIFIIAILLVIY